MGGISERKDLVRLSMCAATEPASELCVIGLVLPGLTRRQCKEEKHNVFLR